VTLPLVEDVRRVIAPENLDAAKRGLGMSVLTASILYALWHGLGYRSTTL
jgi:hypothetical protein